MPLIFMCFFVLSLLPGVGRAEGRTVARLAFQVPEAQMADFDALYQAQIVPILDTYGLNQMVEHDRIVPPNVFSRLFVMNTPAEVFRTGSRLRRNMVLRRLLRDFGLTRVSGYPVLTFFTLEVYYFTDVVGQSVRAGSGNVVRAGSGAGVWSFYDETDGLAGVSTFAACQDTNGHLWFGSQKGLSRFDGDSWQTFTMADGLVSDWIRAIIMDNSGVLWFAGQGGVSCYDPQAQGSGRVEFTNFTQQDGMAGRNMWSVIQDASGKIWVGGRGGLSCYDPATNSGQVQWQTFTRTDGLAGVWVRSIVQDVSGIFWFATQNGVSRYDPSGSSRQARWQTITRVDGLASNNVFTVFQDQKERLWFGTDNGLSCYDPSASSGQWQTFTEKDGLIYNSVHAIAQDEGGNFWIGTFKGVSRYDGQTFTNFGERGGTLDFWVRSIFKDQEHNLWFNTVGGVFRFAGSTWQSFSVKDGMVGTNVRSMMEDDSGVLWIGTQEGVSCYDGETFTNFTKSDGLVDDWVYSVMQDASGVTWFATNGGVSRYDGETFVNFKMRDGLLDNSVYGMMQDASGVMWFCTSRGISCYDGKTFTNFTVQDGLVDNRTRSAVQDSSGAIWIVTLGGVSRFGPLASLKTGSQMFQNYTTQNGLVRNDLWASLRDTSGKLWFGGLGGVSRYDSKKSAELNETGSLRFENLTPEDGLGASRVFSIMQDMDGDFWFGTTGGVSRYDGRVFQTVIREDGLRRNVVFDVLQSRDGAYWFGAHELTRYMPPPESPPPVTIDAVVADRRYVSPGRVAFTTEVEVVGIEFLGVSFKTRPEAMVYRYRLEGYDKTWHTTHDRRVEYNKLVPGSYLFEVQAVDRDLTYSEPAQVVLEITPPLYLQGRFLVPVVGVGVMVVVALTFQGVALVRRRREVARYQQAAVSELNDAREMQLSLLPKQSPDVQGFDIAGICEPATEVGGDYFTYCWLDESHELGIVLMDVIGHGMRAATTAFMANGMLQSEMRSQDSPQKILKQMDRSLKDTLADRSFVAAAFAHLNLKGRKLTHYNAGFPKPILYRDGKVTALETYNAMPLGGPLEDTYEGKALALLSGDVLLLFSDGLTEGVNNAGEMYGAERLKNLLVSLATEETAEACVAAVERDVRSYVAGELEDDLTIVVVRVL